MENDAFNGCTGLTVVKPPDSLLEIGDRTFYDCTSLSEIHLPENLTDAGEEAFVNCTSLKTITVPAKLKLFCPDALVFQNMPSLEKIIFDEGREVIEGYAFFATTSDVEVIIPASVKQFSPDPFFIYGTATFVFQGDCPEILDPIDFYGDVTIYINYDPTHKRLGQLCVERQIYA